MHPGKNHPQNPLHLQWILILLSLDRCRGIGAGIALELGHKGANVVVNYVSDGSREAAANVVAKIEAFGSKALLFQASMTVLEHLPKLVKAAVDFSVTGKIEILVHK